ncbi:hypothetical protein ACWCXE_14275 [Streptomyces sp. NPDC001780]
MGYPLFREVKKHAPAGLTHQEKLTAMVLADDANDDTRLTYTSVVDPEILRQAMVPDARKMMRILAKLREKKVIEQIGRGCNGRTAKYRFLPLGPAECDPSKGGSSGHPTAPKDGQKDHPTDREGWSEEPPNEPAESPDVVEKDHPSASVGWSFEATKGGQKDHPYSSTSSTTTSSAAPSKLDTDADSDAPAPADQKSAPKTASRKKQPRAAPKKPADNRHQVADDLTAKYWDRHGKGRAQSFISIRGVVRTAISNGMPRDDCARALDLAAREGRSISGATLDIALGEIRRGGQRSAAPRTAPRHMTEEEKRDALQF